MMSITGKVPFRIPIRWRRRRSRAADSFLSAARRLEDDLDPLAQGWVKLSALVLFLGAAALGMLLPVPIVAQPTSAEVQFGPASLLDFVVRPFLEAIHSAASGRNGGPA